MRGSNWRRKVLRAKTTGRNCRWLSLLVLKPFRELCTKLFAGERAFLVFHVAQLSSAKYPIITQKPKALASVALCPQHQRSNTLVCRRHHSGFLDLQQPKAFKGDEHLIPPEHRPDRRVVVTCCCKANAPHQTVGRQYPPELFLLRSGQLLQQRGQGRRGAESDGASQV